MLNSDNSGDYRRGPKTLVKKFPGDIHLGSPHDTLSDASTSRPQQHNTDCRPRMQAFLKNVKKIFRVALKSTETRRKSELMSSAYWMGINKAYGDLFYTPKLLPHF